MTELNLILKFNYKGQVIYLIIKDWVNKYKLLCKAKQEPTNGFFYRCLLINYIYSWLTKKINSISGFQLLEDGIDNTSFSHGEKYDFELNQLKIGELIGNGSGLLGDFVYNLNNQQFINLPKLWPEIDINGKFPSDPGLNFKTYREFKVNRLERFINLQLLIENKPCQVYFPELSLSEIELWSQFLDTNAKCKEDFLNSLITKFAVLTKWEIKTLKVNMCTKLQYSSELLPLKITFGDTKFTVLLSNWQEIFSTNISASTNQGNNNFTLPYSLAHGLMKLTVDEINGLEVGDIVFFDQCFAPNQVLLSLNNNGFICDLLATNQAIVKKPFVEFRY